MTSRVGIVMGSDSDLSIMQEAAKVLEELSISYEIHIISAHRTPEDAVVFAQGAAGAGMKAIIAGAGGAAHLPGVLAAYTLLPIIGVPIASSPALMGGLDALLSIVQMPRGIPVACVAINNARNAGLLAAQIIGLSDDQVAQQLAKMRINMAAEVRSRDLSLQQ